MNVDSDLKLIKWKYCIAVAKYLAFPLAENKKGK